MQNTTAEIILNQTSPDYTMYIDYDGDNITDEEKSPDSIETNYAPNATIILPENNSTYDYGEEITFKGNGTDPEDGNLTNTSLVWTSDKDGFIGIGNEFNTANLSAGRHYITLRVNDTLGQINTSTISIFIRDTQPNMFIDILKEDETPGVGHHTSIIETSANDKSFDVICFVW